VHFTFPVGMFFNYHSEPRALYLDRGIVRALTSPPGPGRTTGSPRQSVIPWMIGNDNFPASVSICVQRKCAGAEEHYSDAHGFGE
jgi:hypothetical protein